MTTGRGIIAKRGFSLCAQWREVTKDANITASMREEKNMLARLMQLIGLKK